MSNSAYDVFLDKCIDEYYEEDTEDFEEEPEWDGPYPDDYDNYDGWDDIQ